MTGEEIVNRLERVAKTHDGWKARCPAHEDDRPSLSVGVGEDGRVLLRCFAGCQLEAILAALRLEVSDLFQRQPDTPAFRPRGAPARATADRRRRAVAERRTCPTRLRDRSNASPPKPAAVPPSSSGTSTKTAASYTTSSARSAIARSSGGCPGAARAPFTVWETCPRTAEHA